MAPLMKLDVPQAKSGLQERLMEDAISVLDPATGISLPVDSSVAEAIEAMKQHHVGCLLVTEGSQLTGIFSERDFLLKVVGSGRQLSSIPLREVMTPKPVALSPDHSIRFALHQMSVGGFRHIPLVRNGEPAGIVSIRDVISYLCRELQKADASEAVHAAVNSSAS